MVEKRLMQVKVVIFPGDEGFNVVIWGKWVQGSMRVRHFETRTNMVATLSSLGIINSEEAQLLEHFTFEDTCPLFSAEVDEGSLEGHGFSAA